VLKVFYFQFLFMYCSGGVKIKIWISKISLEVYLSIEK
jgi:hypothetical protein